MMSINIIPDRKSAFWIPFAFVAILLFNIANSSPIEAQESPDQEPTATQATSPKEKRNPSVGAAGDIVQIVLRGSELRAKPLQENSPIVLRILNAFPHGDSFRYDIRFHGLEPGKFDLSNWLERKDGSPSDDLPAIDVEIQSLLPAGQITPNALETGWFPRLGGYRVVAIGLGLLWTLILLGLIFLNRKKAVAEEESEAKMSLADLLKQKIDAATDDRLDSSQYAELERMLFGFWRKRLNLESVSSADALAKIKQHDEAGPLMRQLEQWMHNPSSPKDVNLASMLKPFKNLPANTPGFEEQPGFETQ